MESRRLILSLVALSFASGVFVAPPAHAAGSYVFECEGSTTWPAYPGTYTDCSGTARGTDVVRHHCVPECNLTIHMFHWTACVEDIPPWGTAEVWGEVFIDGDSRGEFVGYVVGPWVSMTGPDVYGSGAMVIPPPFPTCFTPMWITYEIAGEISHTR